MKIIEAFEEGGLKIDFVKSEELLKFISTMRSKMFLSQKLGN